MRGLPVNHPDAAPLSSKRKQKKESPHASLYFQGRVWPGGREEMHERSDSVGEAEEIEKPTNPTHTVVVT